MSSLGNLWRAAIAPFVGRAMSLPPETLRQFPMLAEVRWRRGSILLRAAGLGLGIESVAGLTLWRTVFLRDATPDARLLLHEYAHVVQFRDDKLFFARYLWELARVGYARNRYEVEAETFARERAWCGTPQHPS